LRQAVGDHFIDPRVKGQADVRALDFNVSGRVIIDADAPEQAAASGYLFENPKTGKPIADIKTAWRSALEEAGIPHIPFHCAGRHTFGTRTIDGGAPLSAVKEVMGHSDIRTTMRYVHATDEGKRRAVEAAVSASVKSQSATNLPQADGVKPSGKTLVEQDMAA
jgi:integrase